MRVNNMPIAQHFETNDVYVFEVDPPQSPHHIKMLVLS